MCKEETPGARAARKVASKLHQDKQRLKFQPPKSNFRCAGRKLGSYYADPETNCSTFHLCSMGDHKGDILDFQFMCLEGTLFDQDKQQCRPEDVTPCGGKIFTPALTTLPTLPPTTTTTASPLLTTPLPPVDQAESLPLPGSPQPEREVVIPETADYNITDYEYFEYPEEDVGESQHIRERRSVEPLEIKSLVSVTRTKRAPPPSFNFDSLPATSFSCANKVPGGYYADIETGCQMYHVCAPGGDGIMRSTRFLCSNGTIFSQQTRTCQTWYTVDCQSTPQFFVLNEELSRVTPEDAIPIANVQQAQQQQTFTSTAQRDDSSLSQSFDTFVQAQPQTPSRVRTQQVSHDVAIEQVQPQRTTRVRTQQQSPSVPFEGGTGQPQFVNRFQELAEVQRHQDAIRTVVAAQPARKRKPGRRRRPRPTTSTSQPFSRLSISHQDDIFLEPQTQPRQSPPVASSDQSSQQFDPFLEFTLPKAPNPAEVIVEPTSFNIQDNVPGLLEEIQVRGRFRQTEDDAILDVPRSQPVRQSARLQLQESVQVGVPSSQQILDSPKPDATSNIQQQQQTVRAVPIQSQATSQVSAAAAPSAAGLQASEVFHSSASPSVFSGFDAFIEAAIRDEHEQRARLGPILEQKRLQEEQRQKEEELLRRQEEALQAQQQVSEAEQKRRPKKPKKVQAQSLQGAPTDVLTIQSQVQTQVQPQLRAQVRQPQIQAQVRQPQIQAQVRQPQVQAQVRQPQVQAQVRQPQIQAQPRPQAPALPRVQHNIQQIQQQVDHIQRQVEFQITPQAQIQLDHQIQSRPVISLATQPPQPARLVQSTSSSASTLVLPNLSDIPLFEPQTLQHRPSSIPVQIQQQQIQQQQPAAARTVTVTQPNANLDAILLQQLGGQPALRQQTIQLLQQQQQPQQFQQQTVVSPIRQPLVSNPAAAIRDIVFLLPAESEQLSQTAPVHGPPAPAQVHESRLVRVDSPQSTSFEIRAAGVRRRRAARLTPAPERDIFKVTSLKGSTYPWTPFTCKGKVMGGYYADIDAGCRMFHICSSGRRKTLLYDFRFWCANDTVFDQRSLTCNSPEKVVCDRSPKYFPRPPIPPEELINVPVPTAELMRVRVKRAIKEVMAVGPDDYPQTTFRCQGRDGNKYYADPETNCQLFHLCAEVRPGSRLADYRFLCRNGTVFDQRAQACDDQTDALNCQEDPTHYGIGEIFSRTPVT